LVCISLMAVKEDKLFEVKEILFVVCAKKLFELARLELNPDFLRAFADQLVIFQLDQLRLECRFRVNQKALTTELV
jgi:hypothetical protein